MGKILVYNILNNSPKYLFIIVMSLTISACSNHVKPIKQVPIIDFENSRIDHTLFLSQIADSIKYVQLESGSDSYIGEISEAFLLSDKIVIVDKYTNSVVYFTRNGEFITKIETFGHKETKYSIINDVDFDSTMNTIYIQSKDSIYKFSADCVKCQAIGLNGILIRNTFFVNDHFVTFVSYPNTYNKLHSSCLVLNNHGRLEKTLLPQLHPFGRLKIGPFSNAYKISDTISFWQGISDTIYGVTKDFDVVPRYVMKFDKKRLPNKAYKSIETLNKSIRQGATTLITFYEANSFFIFNVVKEGQKRYYYYDKSTENCFELKDNKEFLINDIDSGPNIQNIIQIRDNLMLAVIFPSELNVWLGKEANNKERISKFLPQILNDLSDKDNPLISLIYLKK
jgi:hypothetical protein